MCLVFKFIVNYKQVFGEIAASICERKRHWYALNPTRLVLLSPRIRNTSVIPNRRRICTHTALYIARTGTRTYVHSRYCVTCIACVYVRGYVPRCYPETESGCASSNGTLVYRLTVVRPACDTKGLYVSCNCQCSSNFDNLYWF